MPHPATVYAFGHMFTKSKNKAAVKDPNPNYLQQRTLLTDLQTSNYLAYHMRGGVRKIQDLSLESIVYFTLFTSMWTTELNKC